MNKEQIIKIIRTININDLADFLIANGFEEWLKSKSELVKKEELQKKIDEGEKAKIELNKLNK